MSEVERDAEARAKDKRERKERADTLRTRGNSAFKRGDYDGALVLFDEVSIFYSIFRLMGQSIDSWRFCLPLRF